MTIPVTPDGVADPGPAEDKPTTRRRRAPLTVPPPPPMTVRERADLGAKLAVIAVLEKLLAAAKADAKAVIGRQMRTSETMIVSLDPDDPDPVESGSSLGAVSKVRGANRPYVADPEKFLAWTGEVASGEVQTIEQVRPSWLDLVLGECKTHGGFAHKVTGGELVIPPGIEFTTGQPQVRVNTSDDAEELVKVALANGGAARFLLDGPLPALPAGEE